jgi:hypothetical protein
MTQIQEYRKLLGACIIKRMKYYYARGISRHARMKRLRNAALASGVVIVLCAASLLLFHKDGQGAESTEPDRVTATGLRIGGCGSGDKKHQGLEHSSVVQLRTLAEYETVCSETVASHVSFFVTTPTTSEEAAAQGKSVAATLKEFARFNISPVVFMEPRLANAKTIDLTTYRSGGYDAVLDTYFAAIKTAGITDAQMGLWTPLPEGNTPVWGNPDPKVFTDIVTRTVTVQKKHFPASKASVLLESKTAASAKDWIGAYTSFLPYVQDIPKGLVDSVGLQGFPWGAAGTGMSATIDPKVYIRADLAVEAARALGAGQVWFNTGTFRHFGKAGFKPLDLTPEQRQTILDGVIELAGTVKAAGLQPAIHLFAKDKTKATEKVDWSYWSPGKTKASPATPVFKTFVHDARKNGIPIWIYDYE